MGAASEKTDCMGHSMEAEHRTGYGTQLPSSNTELGIQVRWGPMSTTSHETLLELPRLLFRCQAMQLRFPQVCIPYLPPFVWAS